MFLIPPYKYPTPQQAKKMTNNARNKEPNNARDNDPDLRQDKEAMKTINTGVIRILKQEIMSDFNDEVWDNLALEWEIIYKTIFTDDGWNFVTEVTDTFDVENYYDYDG